MGSSRQGGFSIPVTLYVRSPTERVLPKQTPDHPTAEFALLRVAALSIQKLNQPYEQMRYLDQFLRRYPNNTGPKGCDRNGRGWRSRWGWVLKAENPS